MSEQATIDEVGIALDAVRIETLQEERRPLLYGALAKAQGEFPSIPKDRTVRVATKTGGSYTFSYAPLDTILRVLRPALAENGLGITQLFEGERLVTLLFHEGGGTLTSELLLPRNQASWQEYGSAVTYARRYAITALLGIASEEDDDGNAASGNVAQPQERAKRAAPKPDAAAGKTGTGPKMAHERQIAKVRALRGRLEKAGMLSEDVYHKVLKNEYQVEHTAELTSEAISHLISRLESYEKAIPKPPAEGDAEAAAERQTLAS